MSAQENKSFSETYPHVVAWLSNYSGNFDFYLSLKNQFTNKGYLSEKQIACVERAIAKDLAPKPKNGEVLNPTYANGTILALGKSTASRISAEVGLSFTYRNIEVVKTHAESPRGILVTFKYSSKVGSHCSICGRPLTDEISCATGVGPDCSKKLGIERANKLDAKSFVAELEVLFENFGEIKEIWLPKLSVRPLNQDKGEDDNVVTILQKPNRYNDPSDY